jgi:hypothetical protein
VGEKFIGSEDNLLHTWDTEDTAGSGAWVDVPAEMTELDLVVTGHNGTTHSVIVESEIGIVHTFTLTDTTNLSALVSLGGHPGGGRIRARWTIGGGGDLSATLHARETRSGLG